MIGPLSTPENPFGVTEDILVANDILRHELAAERRAKALLVHENGRLLKALEDADSRLELLQARLDEYALGLEE